MDMFMHPDKVAALLAGPVVDAFKSPSLMLIVGKRGKFGGDFKEDEEWIEQIKKDKLKKLQEAAKAKHLSLRLKRSRTYKIVTFISVKLYSYYPQP